MATGETLTADEQRLAELGYKQELSRGWSGFSNFAISFSIISVLAGCFTTYGQALNNGGVIKNEYLEEAVQREYRKVGALCPLRAKSY